LIWLEEAATALVLDGAFTLAPDPAVALASSTGASGWVRSQAVNDNARTGQAR